jgi:hypothetical protein
MCALALLVFLCVYHMAAWSPTLTMTDVICRKWALKTDPQRVLSDAARSRQLSTSKPRYIDCSTVLVLSRFLVGS